MTTTTYLEWEDQVTGANNNTWGDVADANWTIFELAIARLATIATTGGSTVLTSSQNRYPVIIVSGVLTSNATIVVRTAEKNWWVHNLTTGNFSLTVKTASGTGQTIPRGRSVKLICDGTNVIRAVTPMIPAAQAGGTVDAITATYEPATTSAYLQDGTMFIVEAAGANTSTTPTFNPDSTGALTITKNGGQALAVGDIRAAGHKLLLCYDATSTRYELLNPSVVGYAVTGASNTFTANQIIEVTDNTNAALRVTQLGTGHALRIEDSTNPDGSAFIIDNAGRVLVGAANSTDPGSRQLVNSGTSSGINYQFGIAPESGALGRNSAISFGSTYSDGWGGADFAVRYSGAIAYGASGGTSDPRDFSMRFLVGDLSDVPTERLRITNTGAVLAVSAGGIGYGTGTGGTVTQLTSKSTGVTLNKTNGQIISHNAALAATSEIAFTVTNSTVAATDVIILSKASGGASAKYDLYVGAVAAGSFDVVIRNVTSTSGSDALTINFAVIKAVTS